MVKNKGGDPPPSVSFHEFLLQAQSNGNLTGIPESYDDFIKPMMDEERRKGFHGFLLQAQSNGNLTGIPESYDDFVKPFASEFVGKQKPVGVTPAPSGDGLGRASQLPSQSQSGVPRPEQIGIEEERPVISETVQEVDFDPDAGAKASDYELRVSRDAVKIRDLTSRLGDDLAFKLLSNEPITEDEKREVMRKTAGSPFFSYAERINVDNPIESVRDAFEGEGFLNDAIEQVTLEKKQQRLSKLGQEGYEAMKADAVRFHGDKAEQVIRNTEQVIQDSFLSDTDRKISEANREINEILRKDEITAEDRRRVADLRREVNSIDDSANTLFDPATGKFISGNEYKKLDASVQSDIESFNDDVLRLSEEARNTPLDVLIDERREAYYAMKGAEKLYEKSRVELGANPRRLSDPMSGVRAVQSLFGGKDPDTGEFIVRRDEYNEAQKRFLALNRAVALNQDPAKVERGFGDIVSRFGEGLGFDKTFDNRDYVEKLTEVFKENGIELTDGQKERVEMSFGEELASGLGATTRIGVELAFNAILANKAKALMNLPKYVRAFEAMMSTRYGKTGRLLSKVMVNAGANLEQGLLFELSGSDYATGVGENIGQGAFTKMLDLLTKGKAGILSKKWARLIGGTGGELVGEYVGDFTSNLNELGITNIEEVMDRTFGTTMEEGARKLLLTSMIVLPLTGSVEIARAFKPKVDEAAAKYPDNEAAQEAKKMVDDVISGDATEFVKPVSEIEPGEEILKPIDLEEQTIETDETGEQEAKGSIDLGTDGEVGDVGEGEVGDTPTPEEDAARLEEIRADETSKPIVLDEQTEEVTEGADSSVEVSKALIFGTPVVRDGKEGFLYQDGQRVIFDGGDIEVDLGNVDEVSSKSVSELGLSSMPEIDIEVNEDNSVVIGGETYVNNFSNPEAAINVDGNGDVVSVNLETVNGQKRTFRGARAEAIAYQYKLKSFENEAGEQGLDDAIEQASEVVKSKGFDVKVKPEGEVEITVKPRKEKVKPIKQSKDEEVKQEEGVEGSVLEGVRSGRNEKEGRQESAELRTKEEGQEVNAKNKTDLFLNARGDKAKSVKVVFKPAYDESKHSNLPENLKDELKKPKVSVFDISTDASDILELVDNPDVESIRYIKGDSDVSVGEKSQEASEPLRDVDSTAKAKEQKSEVKERSKTPQKPEKPAAKERKVKDKERKPEAKPKEEKPKAEKAETKKQSEVKENLSKAKEELSTIFSEWKKAKGNIGAFYDPRSQAEEDVKLLKAVLNLVKAAGLKVAADIKALLKEQGVEVDDDGAEFIASKVVGEKPKEGKSEGESGPRFRKLSTIETIKKSPKEDLSSFMADRTIYYQQESIVDNLNESTYWINSSGRDFEDVIDVASAPSFRPGIRPSVQNGVSIIVADFLSQEIAKRREVGEDVSALSKVLMSVAEGMAVRNKDVGAALNMNKLYMVADAEVMVGAVKQRVKESRKDERAEGEFKKRYNKYKKKVGNEFKRAAKSERVTKTMSPSAEKKAKIRERRKSLLNELEELVSSSAGISFDNWQQAKKNVAISKKILQIAQTYIDEGKVDFADFYNSMSRTLGKSFKFKKDDYAEIYEDLTGEIAGKISDAAKAKIKAQSALGDMSINEIIDAWIDGDKATIDTLVETIVSKSGLTPENAKKLAEALVAEVNSMAVERETSLIKAFFKRRERSKAKTEAEKEADKRAKSLASRIDELERLNGIVDPDLLREYYGEMFGIYELDEGIFEEALKYAKAANKTRGVVREEAIKKWMKLISRAYGPPTFADFYWSMFYPSMLSGVTTHVVNIKGNFWILAFDNIASAISPVPAFFAVIDAYKRKGSVKDAFYAFSLSNPVSSMLFRMMFIAKIQENITEATKALAYGDFDSKWTESAFTSGNMITVSPMESFSMRDAKLFGRNVYKTLIGKGAIRGYESLRYVYRALASVDVLFRGFNLNSNVVPLAINYHLEKGLSPLDAVRKSFEETYFLDKASRDLAKANVVEMGRAYQNATGKKLSKLQIRAAYYAEMRRQMPPQVLSKGTEIARESTLQGEMRGVMGGFGALVRTAHRINVISFLAKKAAPFVKALVNLSNIAIDSNPYGFLRAFNVSVSSLSSIMAGSESRASAMRTSKLSSEPIFYTDKKGVNKAYFRDPMFSLQIGRAMVGSISIYFAMNVFYDLFTASDDDDNEERPFINGSGAGLGREQRRAWQKANAPYTARFWEGGPIVNYQDMPISPILAYLASYIEFERNDEKFKSKPEQERYLAAATVAAQAYLDKGFMMSLTRSLSFNDRIYQLKDFANDPLKSVAGIVKDGISPINPVQLNLFQQVEQILDPQRTSPETAGDYMAYILLGKYYAGGKKDLDYFGDPVETYPGSYQISWNWFVDRRADPVHNFLSDYHLYGSLPEPPDFVPFNGDGLVDPTEEMEYVHKYTFGKEMKRLIRDNIVNSENITDAFIDYNIKAKDGYVIRDKFDYDNLPREEKRELLSKLIKSFKEEAATAADMTVYGSMISDVKFDYSDSEWVNEARKLLSDEIKDGYEKGKSEFVD